MNEPVFTPELIKMIVDEWNLAQQYEEDEPLDGDEVDLLIENLTKEINIHQANELEDEVPFVHGLTDMINKTVEYFK
jgi:hypothetical protein